MSQSKQSPLVSVLVPAYNAAKYIEETIKSLQNQTYNNIEILIADDRSTDNTIEVVEKLASKDKRIRLIKNPKNLYIAENRNVLVKKAKGKYVAWLDSDDTSPKGRIEKQVFLMESDSKLGIVGGYLQPFYDDGRELGVREYPLEDTVIRKKIFRYSTISQGTAMIRREVFEQVGYYNPDTPPAEDLDMLFRIGTKYKFGNVPELVLRYRQHNQSATRKRLRHIETITVKTRFKYMRNKAYHASVTDAIYNAVHFLSIWVIPGELKIRVFNRLRSRKSQ